MSTYRFKIPAPVRDMFGPLPEGDYAFTVTECAEPYESKAGNLVLPLKLSILPDKVPVFANPWAGKDKNGNARDGIAEFLVCVNRAPKEGQEPNWFKVVGAKGHCRLKTEIAQIGSLQGKEVNKVSFFHTPKQIESVPKIAKAESVQAETEPDDIPF